MLSQSTEFTHFRGISTFSQNFVELVLAGCKVQEQTELESIQVSDTGDKGVNTTYFGQVQAAVIIINFYMYTWLRHEIHDCHSSSNSRNIENIELGWNTDNHTVSVSCGYRQQILHIWSGSGGHGKFIVVWGKSAAMSHGIWQIGPRNLEKFAVESWGL